MTNLEREILDDINRLFSKIAELQKRPLDPATNLRGVQLVAPVLGVIEHKLDMASFEQRVLFAELDDELRAARGAP